MQRESIISAKAVYFAEPGNIEVRSIDEKRGPDQVLIKSELIGISHGTEMLFYRGAVPRGIALDETIPSLTGDTGYPIKYGYMNVGRTEEEKLVFAFFPHQDFFFLNLSDAILLPDNISPADAVFLANVETAVSILQDLQQIIGETILIVGQGVVGLLIAEILNFGNMYKVFTTDSYAIRRKASKESGSISLDPSDSHTSDRLADYTGGRGVDKAINVSASPEGLQLAIDCLAMEGTVVEASWYGDIPVPLQLGESFHRKRLRIRSSQVSHISQKLRARWDKGRRMAIAIGLLNRIRPSKYITHVFPLESAREAFSHIHNKTEDTIQVVLKP